MGATASVLAGAAMEPIKKAGSGVSSAVVAVKPSAETQKLVKMYAKEGYRQVAYYTKRGLRSAATGFTIARAIANKLDIAGSAKRKKDIDEREVARRKLLMAKKGAAQEDDGMVEAVSSDLILVEGDEDELSGSGEDRDKEEQDMFHDIFSGGAAQGEGAETFYKESTTDKLKKQTDRAKKHSHKLRLKLATKVCEPKWMPDTKKQSTKTDEAQENKSTLVHHVGVDVMAAVKIKRMLKRRRKEKEKNQFQASMDALKTVNLDAIDGTDVQGWNRSPLHSIEWNDLNIYIIRAYSDCQKEVNVIYESVLPKIRQVMLGSAVNVQMRDLGCVTRPVPSQRPQNHLPPIGIALNSIRERNSIFLILIGYDYGEPWKDTSGTETLKDLGLDVPDEVDFPEDMSEFEILAVRAASESEFKHTVYTSRLSVPRTFLYTCVDPDSPFRNKGGYSPMKTGGGGSPASPTSPVRAEDGGDGFRKAKGSRAENVAHGTSGARSPGGGKSPLNRLKQGEKEHGPDSAVSALSPLKLLKKKKKEEEKRKKIKLAGLIKTVLPALIRDPDTGQLRSPETTFKMIDADGSGRVDKSEFALGLELCGLEIGEEDLDLIWGFLDDDGGGDLDVEEMCTKLESLHKNIAEHEKKQASVMPRLVGNKLEPLLFGETLRMRSDVMKDFQDTAEKQEARWLVKFGNDVLADLHGVCPIIVLAAQEFYEKQDKLMETSNKIPPVPLNFLPEVSEHSGHETILTTAGNTSEEPMWKDANMNETKNEVLDYIKGLSNWPMCIVGETGSGKTSLLAQVCRDLRKEQPFDHILFHSVGAVPDSSDVSLFLFRMIEEVKKRFDVRYELRDLDLDTLMESFPTVLLKAEIDSTLVLVLDNLDLLTKDGEPYHDLDWFPRTFPARCRLIVSCGEGKLLLNIRRNRLQFGGSVELHELKMPRLQVRVATPASEGPDDDLGSKGSSRASSASHAGSDTKIGTDLTELGYVRALARSFLFEGSGLAITLQTSLMEMAEILIRCAEEIYGKYLVHRFCVFVMISRQGVLEQDLYELLNASMQQKVVIGNCRCSWQEFTCLKFHLLPLFPTLAYGNKEIVIPRGKAVLKCLSLHFANELMLAEAHELCAMHYRGQLMFIHGGTWNGEGRRAVTEIAHHMEHAAMWPELLDLAGNLMYIEARSSLGIHQTLSMLADYHHIINKTDGPLHWIKTEVLRVRDSHTMVHRYADQLYKHPRWVFGIGANLPDSTGVSQHAKLQWTQKKEVRPQLVWINKPKVKDACAITLQEPKIVWHLGCFSHDMRFLVTVGQDPRVFIWHPINGHIMYTLEGHTDEVMSVQFSWDDEYIISASRDGGMILWKTPEEAPDRKAEEEEARERASQAGSRASGWSRARSAYSQMSATRPKTGISFKSQSLKGFPKQADDLSRVSSSASVAPKDGPASEGKKEAILKVKSVDDAAGKNKAAHDQHDEDEEGEEEATFSRAQSAASSRSGRSSVKREIVGIQNWYPIKPIVATIPAHRSTLWSCAFSRNFQSMAELHLPITVDLGHNEFRIDHVIYQAYFLNFSGLQPLTPDRFPVTKKGTMKMTRVLTENERNDQARM